MKRTAPFFSTILVALFCLLASPMPADTGETPAEGSVEESGEEYVLPEIEVIETAPPETTEITGEDAVEHGEARLDETLRRSAGMMVEQAAKGHGRFKMRGYDMDMIGFFIDGIPVRDLYNKNIDISQVPVFAYSDISIKRGTSSALYGAGAAVGVVELKSGIPESDRLFLRTELNTGRSDLFRSSPGDEEIYNTGLNAAALFDGLGSNSYIKLGAAYYDEAGFYPSSSLTSDEKKDWVEQILNPEAFGSSLSSVMNANDAIINYTAYEKAWEDVYSRGVNLTAKGGLFLGDTVETGISAAFNYNEKSSLSYQCGYLSTWDEENRTWVTDPAVAQEGFSERDWQWPYMYDWYVTPYYEQRFEGGLLEANAYFRVLRNSLIWSGVYSNWDETTWGGNINADIDLAPWNNLSVALLLRNDRHTESESFYTSPPATPLQKYLGGLRPPDDEVPDTVTVKELAGVTGTLAVEDRVILKWADIYAGVSYDTQFFYRSRGEAGYWRETSDGQWYYELDENDISSSNSLLVGTRDSFNPSVMADIYVIPDRLTVNIGGSMKTRFPSFDNYYSDYYVMGEEVFSTELDNQVSYNFNIGPEYLILPENLSLRCDVYYTTYTNKLENYINADGETVYFNIPRSISYGLEAVTFFSAPLGSFAELEGNAAYTLCIGRNPGRAEEYFEYNPVHEVLFDTGITTRAERFPTKLMVWGRGSFGALAYRMTETPEAGADYPGDYLEAVNLHSPFFLHAKLVQSLPWNLSAFILVENIFDDYGVDPFNPGPGRSLRLGVEYDLEGF